MTPMFQAFINGQGIDSVSGETLSITNPATGQVAAHAAKCGIPDLENAIAAAENAGPAWAATPISEPSKVLLKAAGLIMADQKELAELETMEHGSPIRKTMNFDVPLCAEQ